MSKYRVPIEFEAKDDETATRLVGDIIRAVTSATNLSGCDAHVVPDELSEQHVSWYKVTPK